MAAQNSILFITPVIPKADGTGTEQRAAMWLHDLGKKHQVDTIFLPVYIGHKDDPTRYDLLLKSKNFNTSYWLRLLSSLRNGRAQTPPIWAVLGDEEKKILLNFLEGKDYKCILIFRLYLIPIWAILKAEFPEAKISLDIDDLESETNSEISLLELRRGKIYSSLVHRLAATLYAKIEKARIGDFDHVYVCSESDQNRIVSLNESVAVVSNKIVDKALVENNEMGFNGLFIGALDYPPNREAVYEIIDHIIPKMKDSHEDQDFQIDIVGSCFDRSLQRKMKSTEHLVYHGYVAAERIQNFYRESSYLICPIRAGGGTRIKIIEAFSYGVPVISTLKGAEGIVAVDGEHLLICDTAREFASAIEHLRTDHTLSQHLIKNAKHLSRKEYTYVL